MVKSGPTPTYTINGIWPTPPDQFGWRNSSIKSSHGRLLISLLRTGRVQLSDPPVVIWAAQRDLRVVNPKTKAFQTFVAKCKRAFTKQIAANMPADASYNGSFVDSGDDDDETRPDPPNRMPPPRNAISEDPLMRYREYATRDQQISLPTRVVEGVPFFSLAFSPSTHLILH